MKLWVTKNTIILKKQYSISFDISKYYSYICKMKDITNKNSKEQYHGYQEWYVRNELYYRGNYKNDNIIGYTESHYSKITRYNIR